MSLALFIVAFVVVFFVTLAVLHFFGDLRKTHLLVTLAVFVSWFFSFLIIFILPMDVTNTLYNECLKRYGTNHSHSPLMVYNTDNNGTIHSNSTTTARPETTFPFPPVPKCVKPWSHMPGNVLPYMWRIIYWSSMFLSWILLPIMQSYVYAGAFSVLGKLKTAMYENSLWFGSYLVIFGALLIYVAVDPDLALNINSLKIICITASNTWGLILLVLLLGYGLVVLPRHIWHMSVPKLRLEKIFFKVAKLNHEKEDSFVELSELLSEVKRATEEIRYNNVLRKHVDVIVSKCPTGSETLFSKGIEDYVDYASDTEQRSKFTVKELVKLHKGIMVMCHRAARTQFQYNAALRLAFYVEDVLKAETNEEKLFLPSFSEHNPASRLSSKLRWYWQIILKRWILRGVTILLILFGLCVVWSEVTFFSSKPTLSLLAILVDVAKRDHMFFSIEVVSCLTIAYMCVCAYYTVFKMKFFNYYYFAANHQTDPNSLLFSGYLFCRLTYALCLNFLAMIHMDGHITGQTDKDMLSETDFTRFMGHLDLLSFISKGVNIYYPMIVLLVCFCTYFSFGKRLLHCFGVDQFIVDDDFSADIVREGKEIVKRERRKLEREINRTDWSTRSKDIRNRYNRFDRKNDVERINDSDCQIVNDAGVSTLDIDIRTRLDAEGVRKYTETSDKLDLLNNIEVEPTEPSPRSSRDFDYMGGGSSSVPRNLFNDA